jgi:hypothetical protein
LLDPAVARVFRHAEVARDFVHRDPRFCHHRSFQKAQAIRAVGQAPPLRNVTVSPFIKPHKTQRTDLFESG